VADSERAIVLTESSWRYDAVASVLRRILILNLAVAAAKITLGYATGAVSIISDGFHSLTDASSNVIGLVAVQAARKPPDAEHPYGHRKYETLAAAAIFFLLVLVVVEVLRAAAGRLGGGEPPLVPLASFVVMGGTLAVNVWVVGYERRAATRLNSEILLADSMHTRSDVLTSLTVIAALVGVRLGWPWLDPVAALVVAGFIGRSGYEIARQASHILSDRIVIAEDNLREVVMSVPEVRGCHHIRTRGSADAAFLDLHVWLDPQTPLDRAHMLSHVVKDRLMTRFPQLVDVIIHIEPMPDRQA
jgi:cation diffusion facilitator family transporter